MGQRAPEALLLGDASRLHSEAAGFAGVLGPRHGEIGLLDTEALAVLPPASLGAHAGRLSPDQAKHPARIALGVCAPFVVLLLIAHIFGIVDLRDPVNELPKLVGIGAATDADGNYL